MIAELLLALDGATAKDAELEAGVLLCDQQALLFVLWCAASGYPPSAPLTAAMNKAATALGPAGDAATVTDARKTLADAMRVARETLKVTDPAQFGRADRLAEIPTATDARRSIRHNEIVLTAFVAVVAVGLGLSLLWVGDSTWGGPVSYLNAVLWGLGLHQVGGKVFGGLSGLRDDLLT